MTQALTEGLYKEKEKVRGGLSLNQLGNFARELPLHALVGLGRDVHTTNDGGVHHDLGRNGLNGRVLKHNFSLL
jgi:hypothetical protein